MSGTHRLDTETNRPEQSKQSAGADWVRDPVMTTLIDETGTYTYVGEALPGTLTSAAAWLICRITNASGSTYQSSGKFDQVWDNRATSVSYG